MLLWVWFLSLLALCRGGNVALRSGVGMRKVRWKSLPCHAVKSGSTRKTAGFLHISHDPWKRGLCALLSTLESLGGS